MNQQELSLIYQKIKQKHYQQFQESCKKDINLKEYSKKELILIIKYLTSSYNFEYFLYYANNKNKQQIIDSYLKDTICDYVKTLKIICADEYLHSDISFKYFWQKINNYTFKELKKDFYKKNLNKLPQITSSFIKDLFKNNYKEFLNSLYWKIISEEKKRQANYACQLCGSKNQLNTHHSDYTYYGIEVFNMNKLIVLCKKCHSKFHNKAVK